jgi:phospholipase C
MLRHALPALPAAILLLAACGGSNESAGHGGGASTAATSTAGVGGAGVGGAGGGSTGTGEPVCPSPLPEDKLAAERDACMFAKGAKVADTLGLDDAARKAIPITHVVVVTQENRSFDHLYGKLPAFGQTDVDAWPVDYANPDAMKKAVAPFPLTSTCLEADPPHQWTEMHAGWDSGKMDGFVKSAAVSGSDGHYVMGYYDGKQLPFYYWLSSTFAISDTYFGAALGGTWANRDYLYAATSNGVMSTGQATINVPTIFDSLDKAGVAWGVYTDGPPRQDSLGWTASHKGVAKFKAFLSALADGSLPPVSFVDPGGKQDEHPPDDVQGGEAWGRQIYEAALASPLWIKLAIVYTYDESGGLADHVPPPPACIPSPDQKQFNRRGIRVPAIVISPWVRPHYVSHRVHDHTSTLRLIELINDIPALTARDANADALLDMFDFECAGMMAPPDAPEAGTKGCP